MHASCAQATTVQAARITRGMSQTDVVERIWAQSGDVCTISRRQLTRIESDLVDPRVSVVAAICRAISIKRGPGGITLEDLLGRGRKRT